MTAATAVRGRGITFSAPMVQALLREANPKWQTRRLIKPQPLVQSLFSGEGPALPRRHWCIDNAKQSRRFAWPVGSKAEVPAELCPYGKPGDRLYVREVWYVGKCADGSKPSELTSKVWKVYNGGLWYPADATEPKTPISPKGRYRNARFMPRWASRITLEVTEVRAQQLQEISEADARAEGIEEYKESGLYRNYAGGLSFANQGDPLIRDAVGFHPRNRAPVGEQPVGVCDFISKD